MNNIHLPYIDAFIDYLSLERRSSVHTISAYQRDLQFFAEFLSEHKNETLSLHLLDRVSQLDINAYQTFSLNKQKASKPTVNRRLSAIKTFFKWLNKSGYINNTDVNACHGVRMNKPLPKTLSKADALRVVKAMVPPSEGASMAELRDFALIMVMYGLGLRISEALGLNVSDVKQDHLYVTGKGSKERRLPIPKPVLNALQRLLRALPQPLMPESPIFINQKRQTRLNARSAQLLLKRLREELNLPEHLTPHALRHCFATHLLNNGTDIRTIQALLGHESLAATERYLHINAEALKKTHEETHPLESKENA